MRKIVVGVLSVAGLLAGVLVLSSGPASAAGQVIRVYSATTAGTYTVSWNTQRGCDPGQGMDGASGAVSRTVVDDDTPLTAREIRSRGAS